MLRLFTCCHVAECQYRIPPGKPKPKCSLVVLVVAFIAGVSIRSGKRARSTGSIPQLTGTLVCLPDESGAPVAESRSAGSARTHWATGISFHEVTRYRPYRILDSASS